MHLDLAAVTYGLNSAQILLISWMVFEMRAVKDSMRSQGERLRRVELTVNHLLGKADMEGLEK